MVVFVDLESGDEEPHNTSTTLTRLLKLEDIPSDGHVRSSDLRVNDDAFLACNTGLAAAVGCYPYDSAPRCH